MIVFSSSSLGQDPNLGLALFYGIFYGSSTILTECLPQRCKSRRRSEPRCKGEAAVIYCDPLATQDLGASGFTGRVKNKKIIVTSWIAHGPENLF
jgi:hypothetical protein